MASDPNKVSAIVITPGTADSARIGEVPREAMGPGMVRIAVQAVGVCGTDAEIAQGLYGEAPAGRTDLVLGHESLARVTEVGAGVVGLRPGQLVVPIVRRPCAPPCAACSVGRWDECLTGRYQEHGIKGLDGFMRQEAVVAADAVVPLPDALQEVGVLTEPLTIVEKAVDQALAIHGLGAGEARRALVTGAGPVGLLGALLLVCRGLDVYVVDRRPAGSPKARLVESVGGHYVDDSATPLEQAVPQGGVDIALEATGFAPLVFRAVAALGRNGVLALTGVTGGHHEISVDVNLMNTTMVLENQAMVGSVNAARRHYRQAVQDLAALQTRFGPELRALITERVPLRDFARAFDKSQDSIKTVIQVAGS
jgi:threonine dehydrogenase-like Zn-dependent dehydrogenase